MRLVRRLTTALLVVMCAASLAAETAAGVQWTAPAGWKMAPAQAMRAATYTVAPAAGDKASAECGVYFFGAGQGGSIDANLDRWRGQFLGADGKTAPAKIAKRMSHGLTITTIDSSGDYTGLGGPFSNGKPVPGYRLLGAIVEAPGGNIFVKFTGPARTLAANQTKFDQLLASFQTGK
jgi:hypothetical protein